MAELQAVFGVQHHLVWWQECCRAVLIFCFGLAMVRLAGRRSFSKWSALDIIVSILVGSNLSRALTGSAPLWGTLAATALILILHLLLAHGAARYALVSRILEGQATPLATDGRPDDGVLKRHAISDSDLREALRKSGLDTVEKTTLVVLEPSGNITALKRS